MCVDTVGMGCALRLTGHWTTNIGRAIFGATIGTTATRITLVGKVMGGAHAYLRLAKYIRAMEGTGAAATTLTGEAATGWRGRCTFRLDVRTGIG